MSPIHATLPADAPRPALDAFAAAALAQLEAGGLRRRLTPFDSAQGPVLRAGARSFLNFASNDYLGLAGPPALRPAAAAAARDFGAGSGASRLVCGGLPPHRALEEAITAFQSLPAALAFSSGFAAALGTIPALAGPGDAVILDKLAHACLVDAARLSGAVLRVFRHNDPGHLDHHLRWARNRNLRNILVLTESVFSMDGDLAPLADIIETKERHGAWLLVDEAHATGVLGPARAGAASDPALRDRVDVHMGTLSKAVGASGGYVAGSRPLIDLLVNRARSFIFSTAPAPAAAAAAAAGIAMIASPEGAALHATLWNNIQALHSRLAAAGRAPAPPASAIFPVILGPEKAATDAAARLRDDGLWIPAIRYPTVPRGKARLRLTVTASHTPDQIDRAAAALAGLAP